MTIDDKAVLVTAANRAVGQALVEEGSGTDAERVHTGTRQRLTYRDGRAAPLLLDVTNAGQTKPAVERAESCDVLIEDGLPDPGSGSLAESWRNGAAGALELRKAIFVPQGPVTP